MVTKKQNLMLGIDAADLATMLTLLRLHGVSRLRSGDVEIELGPIMPPRSLDDFAMTGTEELMEDDARFDHVGIKLRKMD